ncbi:MAG: alpha/beta hydrolase [Odoribacteraceae bacterium]|nr:alpha/beta hydrolase [Odoribacteraceae bacterium]
MKRKTGIFTCTALACALSFPATGQRVGELKEWLTRDNGAAIERQAFARSPLSREEAAEASRLLLTREQEALKATRGKEWQEKRIVHGQYAMPFDYRVFGEMPGDGRSLYISMHGGGNTRAEINDGQWRNQARLYAPAEGVYVTPRAAVDAWNMWFQPHVDTLFSLLVRLAVVEAGVNPDKVYLAGYSAGGDGVYRLAPRMADYWAAAAMMAGHPGSVSPASARNIGFAIWVGENDGAYRRNEEAVKFGRKLDSLAAADPGGYRHETRVAAGKGHWMDRQDTLAIPWMASFRRDALPAKIVWQQDDVPRDNFYWLSVPVNEAREGARLVVTREGNTFAILECDYSSVEILLNDDMADLDRKVKVIANGKVIFNKKVNRSIADIYRSVTRRGDPRLVFPARVTISAAKPGALLP